MIAVVVIVSGAIGFLEAFAGFQATHSLWSYGVTLPLAAITGFVAGKIGAEL
jgi:hypothetical protein